MPLPALHTLASALLGEEGWVGFVTDVSSLFWLLVYIVERWGLCSVLGILQWAKHGPCSRGTSSPREKADTERNHCSDAVSACRFCGSTGKSAWMGCFLSQPLENKQVLAQQKRGESAFWPAGITLRSKVTAVGIHRACWDSHYWVRRPSEVRCCRKAWSAMLRHLGFIP